jgi:hypothetical protein
VFGISGEKTMKPIVDDYEKFCNPIDDWCKTPNNFDEKIDYYYHLFSDPVNKWIKNSTGPKRIQINCETTFGPNNDDEAASIALIRLFKDSEWVIGVSIIYDWSGENLRQMKDSGASYFSFQAYNRTIKNYKGLLTEVERLRQKFRAAVGDTENLYLALPYYWPWKSYHPPTENLILYIETLKSYVYLESLGGAMVWDYVYYDITNGYPVGDEGYTCEECFDDFDLLYQHYYSGLIAHWSFDNQVNLGNDNSDNGHDIPAGNFHGDTAWISNGIINGAITFDGNGDYINVWSMAEMNNYVNTTEGSVSIWIKPNAKNGHIYQYYSGHEDRLYLRFDYPANNLSFNIGSGGMYSNKLLTLGTWYHVVAVWEPSGIKLYINGELDSTADFPNPGFTFQGNETFYLGRRWVSDYWYYNGLIDDLRIYDKTLTEYEIKDLYSLGK